jgi:uncharacterized protein involved in exopolysaccharide biosynthesis/Mrp family chromosome partitioning ATPase
MEQQQTSMRDLITVLFKHERKILLAFFGTVAVVTAISFLLPRSYEAKSSLLVRFGRENVYRPEFGNVEQMSILQNQEEMINSEIQILNNRDLIEKVITTIGLKTMYPSLSMTSPSDSGSLEKAVRKFQQNLSVQPVKKSTVIQVSFQHQDPQITARAVNLLVDLFKERHLQVYKGPTSSFLEDQLRTYEEKLRKSANELETFKQKYGVFSLEEQRSLLLKQRTELASSLSVTQNDIRGLDQKRGSVLAKMQSVGDDIPPYTDTEQYRIIDDAKAQLLALQLKEKQLLQKYQETSKFVVDVRDEIEMVKEFLRKQEDEIRKTVRTGKNRNELYRVMETDMVKIEADLSAQKARTSMTEQQLRRLDEDIRNIDSREKDLQALQRRLAASENNYKTYLTKFEEARISENMDVLKMANIRVIHTAAIPVKHVKPRKALNIGLSAILGGLLALGLVFFSEYTGQQLSTPKAVEKQLKLSVLASVKAYKSPIPDLEEEMIELYESIESAASSDKRRIIQFISSVKGEGTTMIVRKFAQILATRFGRSVLLLDANYNNLDEGPSAEAKSKQELGAVIQQGNLLEKALYPVADTGLYLGVLSRHTGLFPFFSDVQKIDQLWQVLQGRFELVLIDSPAATETPEGLVIGRKADGIVLLVEADKTRWPVVASVRDKIMKRHGNLLGVVLNKRKYYIPGWIYRWI